MMSERRETQCVSVGEKPDIEVKDLEGNTIVYICSCGAHYWRPAGRCYCKR